MRLLMLFSKTRTFQSIAGLFAISFAIAAHGQAGYWHTSGNQILDSNDKVVRMAGINWYGFETTIEVVGGLWGQDYRYILNAIQSNGYNVIRLGFSNQMVETPIIPNHISYSNNSGPINTDLKGLNSLQIMDKIIAYAGQIGLHVILDNHRSDASGQSALWYTDQYPESAWIADWVFLTERYRGDSTVIGVDLRNEPHDANNGGACWGCGSQTHDWRLAAERGGNAVLSVNPNLLIFVEGTDCFNNDCDWWGGNLEGAQAFPVTLNVANRLVYSAHDYGPNLYQQGWFNSNTTYASLVDLWTKFWAYLSLNDIAPVWVGEFGTTNNPGDIQNNAPGSQGQWFQSIITFLQKNPQLDWTYWALNGEDPYGLLDYNYDSNPVSGLKQQMLTTIQFNLRLSVAKSGSGIITSGDGHIYCGALCSYPYPTGTQVGLAAIPAPGYTFTGWTGCDNVNGSYCYVTMTQAKNVTATFIPANVTLTSLTFKPTYVRGGQLSSGTVTLSAPAPNGGVAVGLSSDHPGVAHPPSFVVVPGGKTSVSFAVNTFPVKMNTPVMIMANAGSSQVSGMLTVGTSFFSQSAPSNGSGAPQTGNSKVAASSSLENASLASSGAAATSNASAAGTSSDASTVEETSEPGPRPLKSQPSGSPSSSQRTNNSHEDLPQ